jgi:predicted  nucleic acid-binding Zn-ribbon protein
MRCRICGGWFTGKASVIPTCPKCAGVYNRREIVRMNKDGERIRQSMELMCEEDNYGYQASSR